MIRWNRVTSPAQALKTEYEKIKQKNPQFSLRSFAKFVGLSSAYMSHVLLGKKNISLETAEKIGSKLVWSAEDLYFFKLLIQIESSPSSVRKALKDQANGMISRAKTKRVEPSHLFSSLEWQHLLLLVCISFRNELKNESLNAFSQFSGLKPNDTKRIINDLIKAKLIKKEKESYKRTQEQLVVSSEFSNEALKKIHRSYLERAKTLISDRSLENRFSATEFLSIPRDKFPAAKEKAEQFLDELGGLSRESGLDGALEVAIHLNFFKEEEIF